MLAGGFYAHNNNYVKLPRNQGLIFINQAVYARHFRRRIPPLAAYILAAKSRSLCWKIAIPHCQLNTLRKRADDRVPPLPTAVLKKVI